MRKSHSHTAAQCCRVKLACGKKTPPGEHEVKDRLYITNIRALSGSFKIMQRTKKVNTMSY